jgi:hypothetical protein
LNFTYLSRGNIGVGSRSQSRSITDDAAGKANREKMLRLLREMWWLIKEIQWLIREMWWLIREMWWLISDIWWLIRDMWWLIREMWWFVWEMNVGFLRRCGGPVVQRSPDRTRHLPSLRLTVIYRWVAP